jgi:sortase A
MGGKAIVAQILLDKAWASTLETGQGSPPWAWMDTVPIAKITVPTTQNSAIVLNTLSGQALAFGPAHMTKTPLPGEPGISVIAAHKNTHFSFLKDLRAGDEIIIQRTDGQSYTFVMTGADIVHKDNSGIPDIQGPGQPAQLALVTCYPFDSVSYGCFVYF